MASSSAHLNGSSAVLLDTSVMQARLGELESKLQRKRERIRTLERENNFYHQTTTIFLTIKKVMEKEKQFCFLLADLP
jgi:hypothetical protein